MKTALVHDFLTEFGGAERVLAAFRELFPNAPIYTLLYNPKLAELFPEQVVRTSALQKLPAPLRGNRRLLLPLYPFVIEQFDFSGYDLVLSDSSSFAKGIISRPETLHINYCHTPTRYLWDYTNEYLEELRVPPFFEAPTLLVLHFLRIWDQEAAQRPDVIIANSENVRQRIQKYYKRDAQVIYPPLDLSRFPIKRGHEDYFLIVSRLSSYKRIDLAIEAANRLGFNLTIIGEGSERRHLEALAGPTIEFLGFKPDDLLPEYYANARALIFPGEEDFGLTPIEAMATGTPVIAYRRGGLLESVKEGVSGVFFDEPVADSLILAIERFLDREDLFRPERIRRSVEPFAKERFLARIERLIGEAMREHQRK